MSDKKENEPCWLCAGSSEIETKTPGGDNIIITCPECVEEQPQQAQGVSAVRVCPTQDRECGPYKRGWCRECPNRLETCTYRKPPAPSAVPKCLDNCGVDGWDRAEGVYCRECPVYDIDKAINCIQSHNKTMEGVVKAIDTPGPSTTAVDDQNLSRDWLKEEADRAKKETEHWPTWRKKLIDEHNPYPCGPTEIPEPTYPVGEPILIAGKKYKYTTSQIPNGISRRKWWEMTVIHHDPKLRKVWVKMTKSGIHRVIGTQEFVFKLDEE